jgi:hypothetical protein
VRIPVGRGFAGRIAAEHLPQAFVHAAMLECTVRLAAAPPGRRS